MYNTREDVIILSDNINIEYILTQTNLTMGKLKRIVAIAFFVKSSRSTNILSRRRYNNISVFCRDNFTTYEQEETVKWALLGLILSYILNGNQLSHFVRHYLYIWNINNI